jgi:AraC family ethanolamine operon transcriptional activator
MTDATRPRAYTPRAGFFGVAEFDDFDAIRAVSPDWDMLHLQIGRGRADARVVAAQTPEMLMAVVRRSPGILERGTPPPGTVTFTISLRGSQFLGQRLPWGQDRVAFVPQGVEYEFLSTGPSTLFTLSVSKDRLDQVALEHLGESYPGTEAGPYLRFRDGSNRSRILGIWCMWLAGARRKPGLVCDPGAAARMEEEVLRAVVDGTAPEFQGPPPRPYRELALRVESYIRRSLEEQITIEDICAATRASPRSIHASFQKIFGMPPKSYWKALRLASARQDLLSAGRGMTVSDVAVKWNFYRFGYFAIDYRAVFGENPSDTLYRARGRSADPGPTGSDVAATARNLPAPGAPLSMRFLHGQ